MYNGKNPDHINEEALLKQAEKTLQMSKKAFPDVHKAIDRREALKTMQANSPNVEVLQKMAENTKKLTDQAFKKTAPTKEK
jgi:hypothetical protein